MWRPLFSILEVRPSRLRGMGGVECRLGPRCLQAEGTARLGLFLERAMWVSRGDNKECGPIKHYCSPGGFRAQQMIVASLGWAIAAEAVDFSSACHGQERSAGP